MVIAVARLVRGVVLANTEGRETLSVVPACEDGAGDGAVGLLEQERLADLAGQRRERAGAGDGAVAEERADDVPSFFVKAHVLPVSDELSVFVVVAPVT